MSSLCKKLSCYVWKTCLETTLDQLHEYLYTRHLKVFWYEFIIGIGLKIKLLSFITIQINLHSSEYFVCDY
ncbi:hypothetical protein J437_LFUL012770 [Ladona fulva]|uniref:Uncharacterized protein n=1 Tax=Ladona fulva TaxID=123851 RepID=A0A8K0KTY3_LADFU|nr:hypothetical protein J437_LFUL012770 [Ladona fulva]